MNKEIYKIRKNERLTGGIWRMVLEGDTSHITAPGQFVNIALPGRFLRRPISICDWDAETITIVYRIAGGGTLDLSTLRSGAQVEMLTGLGNGFSLPETKDAKPLLVGGGVGLPPMLGLAKALIARGITPIIAAGFSSKDDIILTSEFQALGITQHIATMDGSLGVKGTVMEAIKDLDFDCFYACGPKPMLKALGELPVPGELSVEERMGCGFGICMGCSCKTTDGMKRVCKEGPVFRKEEGVSHGQTLPPSADKRGDHERSEWWGRAKRDVCCGSLQTTECNVTLSTSHGTIALNNPVIAASGTAGYGRELSEWFDLNEIGGISIKGTTLSPREGNALPRIAETPSGLLNCVGLQNPGIDAVVETELPWLRENFGGCVIANISGFGIDEYRQCAERLTPELADIIEVNISCPNVHGGGMAFGTDPKAAYEVTKAVRESTDMPIFIKLSPNVTDIAAIARACVDAGADGLCLINTVSAMRIDLRTRKPLLSNVTGGLSGPAVFPLAVRMVYQVSHAVNVPIIGCGGVSSASDVLEMIMAGATAVEVGSASLVNPTACRDIARDLPAEMAKYSIENINDIIGIC